MDACIDHGLVGGADGYASKRVGARVTSLHRWTYAEHHGLDEATMGGVVRHTCDNTRCIQPTHLELGTHQDNSDDMVSRGRTNPATGEDCPWAKLNWEKVRRIRALYIPHCREFGGRALLYGVDQSVVSDIVNHKIWKE